MELTGRSIIAKSPTEVWDLLQDPAVLRRCIPGCRSIDRVRGAAYDVYRVEMHVEVGIVGGLFRGELRVRDPQPGQRCRLEVSAKGRTGAVEGTTEITLTPRNTENHTEVAYRGRFKFRGLAARLGAKLFGNHAQRLQDQFFEALEKH